MTNKEAVEILNRWYLNATDGMTKERLGYIDGWFNEKDKKAFEFAIKALEWQLEKQYGDCDYCKYKNHEPSDYPLKEVSHD